MIHWRSGTCTTHIAVRLRVFGDICVYIRSIYHKIHKINHVWRGLRSARSAPHSDDEVVHYVRKIRSSQRLNFSQLRDTPAFSSLQYFAAIYVMCIYRRFGAATPKVRHSEGPPFRRIETKLGLQVGLA